MAGSSWPSLVAGAKAKASEVELKFDWIEGDIVPMIGGTKTDATYDLGESSFRWRDIRWSRQALSPDGSIGTPGLSFANDTNSGFYRIGVDNIGVTLNGVKVIDMASTTLGIYSDSARLLLSRTSTSRASHLQLLNSAAGLTIKTGLSGAGEGSTVALELSNDVSSADTVHLRVLGSGQFQFDDGSASTPVVSFINDTDTGIYRVSANTLAMAVAGAQALQIQQAGEVTMPLQPAFLAFKTADATNVTGNGTNYTVVFDSEIYDQGADYNNVTGTFTAPVTGRYFLTAQVGVLDYGAASGRQMRIRLVTSNRTYLYQQEMNNAATAVEHVSVSAVCDMDSADTVTVSYTLTGVGADTADVDGDGASIQTCFSGCLLA